MWPFKRKDAPKRSSIHADVSFDDEGTALVDVRGQTCPGYLLAINNAVEPLPAGTAVRLIISYPPCGDDVHAWCKEKGLTFGGIEPNEGLWHIHLKKPL